MREKLEELGLLENHQLYNALADDDYKEMLELVLYEYSELLDAYESEQNDNKYCCECDVELY